MPTLQPRPQTGISGEAVPPTHVRHRVLALAVCMAAITYLDRVCISITAPQMMRDLSLSPLQMSFVFSAFTTAYGIFEIPTGWWGDRIGTRRVLTRIVAWWSTFTIATAAATSYASLLIIRFLFGMGEAGAWPNAARTFSRWFPLTERGTAQGIFFMGAHLGGGLTPLLVTALLAHVHWRAVFVIFGLVGFVWAWAWYRWFRDDPSEHHAINAAELENIRRNRLQESAAGGTVPWKRLLKSRSVIALCLMYFTQTYGFYFYITWFPTYLKNQGFTSTVLSLLSGLPLILSVVADLLGGVTTDAISKRWGLRVGRCAVGGGALALAGLAILGSAAVSLSSRFSPADLSRGRQRQLSAGSQLGCLPGHCRAPRRRCERLHEHGRSSRRSVEPHCRSTGVQSLRYLDGTPLPHWNSLSPGFYLLVVCPPGRSD